MGVEGPDLKDEIRSRLCWVERTVSRSTSKKFILTDSHFYAALRVVRFAQVCRVVKASVHVIKVDRENGKEADWFYKYMLRARIASDDSALRTVTRTVTATEHLLPQLLYKEGDFGRLTSQMAGAALIHLVPQEQWDALAKELSEWNIKLKEDKTFQKQLEACRRGLFQKDREVLIREMERLQKRSWRLPDVVECWNEALVKGVMES